MPTRYRRADYCNSSAPKIHKDNAVSGGKHLLDNITALGFKGLQPIKQ